MLMPAEFIFAGYNSPYADAGYDISNRQIAVTEAEATADVPAGNYTLYEIQYNDDVQYNTSYHNHYMYFTVGPEVDTASLQTNVLLPSALGLATENTQFPYSLSNTNYRMQDRWDFDEDGDKTEYFATPYEKTRVTINAVRSIFAQSYITSSHTGAGESIAQNYQHNSTGTYKLYINNGLDSGNTARDSTITITVPRIDYPGTQFSSQWDVLLTGEPVLRGAFFAGADITYSVDGGNTYQDTVADYSAITNVKVQTQPGIFLQSSENARIELPFRVSFPQEGVSGSSRAYFAADFRYFLNSSETATSTSINVNTLTAAPIPVSGSVFKDFNADGIQDDNEKNNYKSYYVTLYKGAYTSATTGLQYLGQTNTNYYNGSYSFTNVYLPGTYTLRVDKANDEYYPSSGIFVQDGETNSAYYTFTLDEADISAPGLDLGIVAPRILQLNATNIVLYEDGPIRKIVPTVYPQLADTEAVNYSSSAESIVTVAADGTLDYVDDGDATVTVSVPQVASLTHILGEDPVTAMVQVRARKSSYSVKYMNHEGTDISEQLLTDYADYMSYNYGYTTYLPTVAPYTRTGYTFAGWYSAASGGTRIHYFSSSQYGDQTVYARWNANNYSISYQGMDGAIPGNNYPSVHTYGTETPVSDPTRSGYDFTGWNINGSATSFKSLILGAPAYTADITLKANWTLAEPSVNLTTNAADNTVIYGTTITITANASHPLNPTFSYAWYKQMDGGEDISAGTGSTLNLSDAADSGKYYCLVAMSDGIEDVSKTSEPVSIAILKADGVISDISDIGKTYDGTSVAKPDFQKSSTGNATVLYKESGAPDSSYSSARPVDAGDYVVKIQVAGDDNYNQAEATKDFTISPRTITVTPDIGQEKTYGEADPAFTYTSDAHLVAVDAQTPVFTGSLDREAGENAGSYNLGLGNLALEDGSTRNTFKAVNYRLVLNETAVEFTIAKRPITLTADSVQRAYNGEALQSDTYSITSDLDFPEGEGLAFVVVEGSQTLTGSSANQITDYALDQNTDADNYSITLEDGQLTVTVAEIPITIIADSREKTYDGTPLTLDSYTVQGTLATGNVLDVVIAGRITDYGLQENVVTSVAVYHGDVDVTKNYRITQIDGELRVNKRPVIITASDMSKAYDGTHLYPGDYDLSADAFVAGEGFATLELAGSQLFPGNSAIELAGYQLQENTKADNYQIEYIAGTLTVETARIPITVAAASAEKIYDGEALSADEFTVKGTLATGDQVSAVISGEIGSAGSADNAVASAKVTHEDGTDVTENYVVTVEAGTLTITARPYIEAEFTVSPVQPIFYTGGRIAPKPVLQFGNIALEEGTDYTLSYQNNVYPGTARILIGVTGNYSGETIVYFTIKVPEAETQNPSQVRHDSAMLQGTYQPQATGLTRGFKYKETTTESYTDIEVADTEEFAYQLDDLQPDTDYEYYAYVRLNGQEYAAESISFTTTAAPDSGNEQKPPQERVQFKVEVGDQAPDIKVNGMEALLTQLADDTTKGITREELESGQDIEIKVIAKLSAMTDEKYIRDKASIEEIAQETIGLFFDLSVLKTITGPDGAVETQLSEVPSILEIIMPLPDNLAGQESYVVYRVHNDQVEKLTQTPNVDGEYIEIRQNNLILNVRKFSTYALAYSAVAESDDESADQKEDNAGNRKMEFWWIVPGVAVLALLLWLVLRKKQKQDQ